jgi:hypothetical protein
MRTDDLICMMAKTPPCSCIKRNARIWACVAALFFVFLGVVAVTLGIRPDLGLMTQDSHMLFKYAFLGAVTVGSGIAWWYSGHPTRSYRIAYYGLMFLAAFLVAMAVRELMTEGVPQVSDEVFDYTAFFCAGFITAFALLGSFVLTRVTGCMAPTNCRLHAFMTALFATSLGALAYGLHCTHDHPAYLVLWYAGTGVVFTAAMLPVLMKKQAW